MVMHFGSEVLTKECPSFWEEGQLSLPSDNYWQVLFITPFLGKLDPSWYILPLILQMPCYD